MSDTLTISIAAFHPMEDPIPVFPEIGFAIDQDCVVVATKQKSRWLRDHGLKLDDVIAMLDAWLIDGDWDWEILRIASTRVWELHGEKPLVSASPVVVGPPDR